MSCLGCAERKDKLLSLFGMNRLDSQQRLFNHFAQAIHRGANRKDIIVAAANTIALCLREEHRMEGDAEEDIKKVFDRTWEVVQSYYDSQGRRKEVLT